MVRNTFCHLPGIGVATERRIWDAGIHTWEQLLEDGPAPLTPGRLKMARHHLARSLRDLDKGKWTSIVDGLPTREHWRLYAELRHNVAYLDIETNGWNGVYADITTIAMYDGRELRCYVNGDNLEQFPSDLRKYKAIVTYNGKQFDVPTIQNYFDVRIDHVHIDLRFVLSSLGFKGGLKRCEKALGLDRGDLDGVDGFFAVLLWEDYYHRGNRKALETLLAYNAMDTVNLERLAVEAYNRHLANTPFAGSLELECPLEPVEVEYRPDLTTIDRIKTRFFGYQPRAGFGGYTS